MVVSLKLVAAADNAMLEWPAFQLKVLRKKGERDETQPFVDVLEPGKGVRYLFGRLGKIVAIE
jgi:hypothetical protein